MNFDKISNYWFNKREPFRYLIIGGYNTAFSLLLFFLVYDLLGTHIHYIIILAITHILSVLNSTISLDLLVFRPKVGFFIKKYIKANLTYATHFVTNSLLLFVMINLLSFKVIIAQIIATTILTVPIYFVHKFFSFANTTYPYKKIKS